MYISIRRASELARTRLEQSSIQINKEGPI